METLDGLKADVGFDDVLYDDQIGKVSVIGVGMRSHPGVSAKFFSALADVGVNIEMISTSEIRISVIVDQDDVDRAVVAAHRTGIGCRRRGSGVRRYRPLSAPQHDSSTLLLFDVIGIPGSQAGASASQAPSPCMARRPLGWSL